MSEIEVDPERYSSITALKHFPALPGCYEDFPAELDSRLAAQVDRGLDPHGLSGGHAHRLRQNPLL